MPVSRMEVRILDPEGCVTDEAMVGGTAEPGGIEVAERAPETAAAVSLERENQTRIRLDESIRRI